MALVERYHVVAAERAVASGQTIKEGQVVSLNSSGQVILQGSGTYNKIPYGLAGDTKSTTASSMPGIATGWQNSVDIRRHLSRYRKSGQKQGAQGSDICP